MKVNKRHNKRTLVRECRSKVTPMTIEKYIRRELNSAGWNRKKDNKCYITGRTDNLESHHNGKSFLVIMYESIEKLGIEYKPYVSQYDILELAELKNEIVRRHRELKPIILCADVHQALHDRYGREITDEQLEEFKSEYNKQIA